MGGYISYTNLETIDQSRAQESTNKTFWCNNLCTYPLVINNKKIDGLSGNNVIDILFRQVDHSGCCNGLNGSLGHIVIENEIHMCVSNEHHDQIYRGSRITIYVNNCHIFIFPKLSVLKISNNSASNLVISDSFMGIQYEKNVLKNSYVEHWILSYSEFKLTSSGKFNMDHFDLEKIICSNVNQCTNLSKCKYLDIKYDRASDSFVVTDQ